MSEPSGSQIAPGVEITESVILIRINKLFQEGMSDQELYEAVWGRWVANGPRRDKAEYAMAVHQGTIRAVYRIDEWHAAETTSYLTRRFNQDDAQGRWEFVGAAADEAVQRKYLGKSVAHYFRRGAQNPITYVNCAP